MSSSNRMQGLWIDPTDKSGGLYHQGIFDQNQELDPRKYVPYLIVN